MQLNVFCAINIAMQSSKFLAFVRHKQHKLLAYVLTLITHNLLLIPTLFLQWSRMDIRAMCKQKMKTFEESVFLIIEIKEKTNIFVV